MQETRSLSKNCSIPRRRDCRAQLLPGAGLRYYQRQTDTTQNLCYASIEESLRKSGTNPGAIGTVLVDADTGYCSEGDRLQIFESLHLAGIKGVPVTGLSLQTCSATAAALDLADRLVRTDEKQRPVLVRVKSRAMRRVQTPHASRSRSLAPSI